MRVTQIESYRNFLSNIETLNESMNTVNRQLSTGKKLTHLNDSPSGSAEVAALSEQASDIDQFRENADSGEFVLQAAESALNAVQNLVTAVYTKGSGAASNSASADARAMLASEVRSLRDQILSLANSEAHGRYIFAGSRVTSVPFTIVGDAVTYQGDGDVNTISVGEGLEVRQNVSGSAVFDPIFAAVNSLLTGLDANDPAGIQAALGQFSSALSGLSQIRSQVGADLSQLENVKADLDARKINVREQRSRVEDTDLAEAVVQLNQIQTALKAAISAAGSVLPQRNLFDILG